MRIGSPVHRSTPAVAVILLLVGLLAGCTVTRMDPVGTDPIEIANRVDIGDYVRVFLHDESMYEFEVTRLNSNFIGSTGVQLRYEDIAHVDVRVVDEFQTAFTAAQVTLSAVYLIAVVVLLVLILAA